MISRRSRLRQLEETVDNDTSEITEIEARIERNSHANAYYIAGLGYLGLNQKVDAGKKFAAALQISPDHLGAKTKLAEFN